jgi:hypothetical protein
MNRKIDVSIHVFICSLKMTKMVPSKYLHTTSYEWINVSDDIKVNNHIKQIISYAEEIVDIVEAKHYIPCVSISSVDVFLYQLQIDESLDESFNTHELKINEHLRNLTPCPNFQATINGINTFINHSPVLDHNITVYRGLSEKINVNVGDVLDNLGFMYVSLDQSIATYFMNDTSECYMNDTTFTKPAKSSTVFTIQIPPGTHMWDKSYFEDRCSMIMSQFVLSKDCKLLVTSYEEDGNISYVGADLIVV